MNTVRKIAGSAAELPLRREGAGSNFAGAFAASRWRRDMKKLLAVLADRLGKGGYCYGK